MAIRVVVFAVGGQRAATLFRDICLFIAKQSQRPNKQQAVITSVITHHRFDNAKHYPGPFALTAKRVVSMLS